MRLNRTLIGKQVRVRWVDPREVTCKTTFPDRHDIPRGKDLLAIWEEWGKVDDVTDGVLRLLQGVCIDPPNEAHQEHRLTYSAVPEALIESIVVLDDRGEVDGVPPITPRETA